MTTIAFDFDGVFLPDCDHIPNLGDEEAFYAMQLHMHPIFVPQSRQIIIITARPAKQRIKTALWTEKHFPNNRVTLFQEIMDNEHPAEYKARILNLHILRDVVQFVESDATQVEMLRKLTDKEIIHFSSAISTNLKTPFNVRLLNEH